MSTDPQAMQGHPEEECTGWPGRLQTQGLQPLERIAAACVELVADGLEPFVALPQGRHGNLLAKRRYERGVHHGPEGRGADAVAGAGLPTDTDGGQGMA